MILSEQFRFVFIKTQKTAGTSIEVDLSRRVEAEAIVTPIMPAVTGHQPRNFRSSSGTFRNHMTALQIRSYIGQERWARLFSFCVEREPVAKCISHFHMRRARGTASSWEEYVAAGNFPIDHDKYTDAEAHGRKIIVSRVLPYEKLDRDLPALMLTLGMADFALLSRAKSEYAAEPIIRIDDVSPLQRERIYAAFREGSLLHGLYPEAC